MGGNFVMIGEQTTNQHERNLNKPTEFDFLRAISFFVKRERGRGGGVGEGGRGWRGAGK